MLTRLRHGAIGSGHNENRAVNLSSASDHVLDVVSVARHINVGVVTVVRLILNVGN